MRRCEGGGDQHEDCRVINTLQYAAGGEGLSLKVIVHHDDAEREYAYDRDSVVGRLEKGLDEAERWGITVVSMKDDWRTIFSFDH